MGLGKAAQVPIAAATSSGRVFGRTVAQKVGNYFGKEDHVFKAERIVSRLPRFDQQNQRKDSNT